MELTIKERDRRWQAARTIMVQQNLDAIIAHSNRGDTRGSQRYLSGYRSVFSDVAVVIFAEGDSELVLGHPATIVFAKELSWIPNPTALMPASGAMAAKGPTVGGGLEQVLKDKGVTRIGVAGLEQFPQGWFETLKANIPNVSFVDVGQDLLLQRLVKSPEEQALVRTACRISDLVWEAIPAIIQPGRKRYEAMADIEHLIRLNGCEDSFNLIEVLPMLAAPKDRRPFSAMPIQKGDVYMVEVSPRYLGYYGQQTTLVTVDAAIPTDMRHAYDSVNRARAEGLKVMKAGVDILEVTAAVNTQLAKDGHQPASPFIGHFVGLELEELRAGNQSLILEEGMTFIFHPFAAGHPAVMRADTYLITKSGFEELTTGDIAPLAL